MINFLNPQRFVSVATSLALAGSGTIAVSGSGTMSITEHVALVGSGTIALGGTGTISTTENVALTGSGTIALGGTGTISTTENVALSGSSTIALGGTGTLSTSENVALTGSGTIALGGTGTLSTSENVALAGSGTIALGGTGTLSTTEPLALAGSGTIALGGTGTLSTTENVALAGSGTIALGGTGTLSTIENVALTGSGTIALGGTGTISTIEHVALSGSGTIALGGIGTMNVVEDVALSGSGTIALGGTGTASVGTVAFANTYSIYLDGSDDYATSSFDADTLIGTGDFTYSIWVKYDAITNHRNLGGLINSSANEFMRIQTINSTTDYVRASFNNNNSIFNVGQAAVTNGTWYNIVVTRTGTTAELWLNGVSQASGTDTDVGTGLDSATLLLGAATSSNLNYNHKGLMDEVAIWDEKLTDSEIAAIYNSGAPIDLASDSGNYASSANLVGYWRFEENTGTSIADSSVKSNTVTLNNGPTFSTDVPVFSNFSISLDGSNNYIDLGNPSELQITGPMSISMWFKTSSGSANRLIAKDGGGGQPRQYVLLLLNNKLRWVRFNSSGTLFTIDSVDTYNDNAWHHVVVTNKSTGTIDMFVDGVQLTEGTGSGNYTVETTNGDDGITMNNASVDIEIGYFAQANSQYFNGLIDEVAIWNDALSASEVTKIYNNGLPINIGSNNGNYTSSTNLQGWWRFEENTGTSIADSSSNSNTATLNNGPTFSTDTP